MAREEAIEHLEYIHSCLDMTYANEQEQKLLIAIDMAIKALKLMIFKSSVIMTDENIKKIIAASDKDTQIDKAIEECSELIKALLKERYAREIEIPTRREEIIEEMADVLIMCWQLQVIFEIPDDEIGKRMEFKIDRTLRRMEV